jgi:tetratricopeptide (TPR) repeat protein
MRTHLDYNKVARKILEDNKTNIHKKLCFNLMQKSLEIEPNFFGTYHLLGVYYSDLNDFLNAEINYKKSIKLNQNNTSTYINLFTIYHKHEKINKAIEIGNKLINLGNFDFDDFYTQLGMMYLLNGAFENGWKYYEFTKAKENLSNILNFKEEVVITAEQGLGDNLSLDDVSAIIMNCDIVITPCTMISHLSSALGKETWVLIQKIPYWFWGLNIEENIWYSSVKLFRQNKDAEWSDVFQRINQKLISL